MNPMIQVDVFCLRKLPSDVKGYTVDVFNKEIRLGRDPYAIVRQDPNRRTFTYHTVARLKDDVWKGLNEIQSITGTNAPLRSSIKLYTGGFLIVNGIQGTSNTFVEMQDDQMLSYYGYANNYIGNLVNQAICITDDTCANSCGQFGVCKLTSYSMPDKPEDKTTNTGFYSCVCNPGYAGVPCASCNPRCNNGGQCVNNTCQCAPGWGGPGCNKCTNTCSGHGKCSDDTGKCICDFAGPYDSEQWKGENCERCTKNCNWGACNNVTGKCDCPPGYIGDRCEQNTNPACQNGGRPEGSGCWCPPGWEGADCSICKRKCLNGGTCTRFYGECECTAGWTGPDCSQSNPPLPPPTPVIPKDCFKGMSWPNCSPTATAPLCGKGSACCVSNAVPWTQIDSACPPGYKNTDYCTSSVIPWASTYRAKCVQK